MSVAASIRRMMDAGLTIEQALIAVEAVEAVEAEQAPAKSSAAIRQARYRERKRNGDVTTVTERNSDACDAPSFSSPKRKVSPCTPSKENTPSLSPVSEPNGSSKKRAIATISLEFAETFWPAYPHKIGKPEALKKFEIARRGSDLESIMAGLHRYVATKPADRNWCNPATWLNQQRWTDEPAQSVVNSTTNRPRPPPNVPSAEYGFRALQELQDELERKQRHEPVTTPDADGWNVLGFEPRYRAL